MSRLLHLSDLHFGKDREDLLEPLLACVNDLRADLVAISGDFTQRARETQFEAARRFISRIEAPVLAVPGNHDIPIHRPFTRFFFPLRRYRKFINNEVEPTFVADDMTVVGINTVNRFAWQSGRMGTSSLARACRELGSAGDRRLRVIVAHHPLEQPGDSDKKMIPRAREALTQLLDCGADLILSGHLHVWHAGAFAHRTETGNIGFQLHAGTSLSSRVRGEANNFNCIEVAPGGATIARYGFDEELGTFVPQEEIHFDKAAEEARGKYPA
ncbi:MAG: metallophosphoesterase [Sulfitobacter sp.]|nr:metallophosphoesterase [Sulfitobacter sp.]